MPKSHKCALTALLTLAISSDAFAQRVAPQQQTRPPGAGRISPAENQDQNEINGRRCAFHGYRGTFILSGANGTAAYRIGSSNYIADLVSIGEDPNWWIYSVAASDDPATTMWAFARRPHSCGKYWVIRFSNGVWRRHDLSEGWGIGLGQSFGGSAQSITTSSDQIIDRLDLILEAIGSADQEGGVASENDIRRAVQELSK